MEERDAAERWIRRHVESAQAIELARERPWLGADRLPAPVQHDDLHMASVYVREGRFRILDWGDSSISYPFFSLMETFRFLEEHTGLGPGDRWFAHALRRALEVREA